MAKISKIGVEGIGDGILFPSLQHRFIVSFSVENDSLYFDSKDLSQQIVSTKYSLATREVSVTIEEPVKSTEMLASMISFAESPATLTVFNSDGNFEKMDGVCFYGLTLDSHECVRDYGNSDAVKHQFTFKFANIKSVNYHKS